MLSQQTGHTVNTVFIIMGAGGSKPGDEGIITVNPSSSTPVQRGASAATNATKKDAAQGASATEPLLLHLQDLKAKFPKLDAAVNSSSKAVAAADPDSLLLDIEQLKQLTNDTGRLNGAVTTLITSYQAWHDDNVKLLSTNQEYIHRIIDQAESKADKAVRHVQLQTSRLRNLTAGLKEAEALPGMISQLTASAAVLQEQLQQLEQLHFQQQQQQQQQQTKRHEQRPPAAAGARTGSGSLFRRSPSPTGKKVQRQQQQQGSEDEGA